MIVAERRKNMKKKIKRNKKVDFVLLEKNRVSIIKEMVKVLNDDACNLSSCEIRKYILDAMYAY